MSGWAQVSLEKTNWKIVPKYYHTSTDILGGILSKVVSHYDLSVPSMSVMGFQTRLDWVGGVSSRSRFFGDFLNVFNFVKTLSRMWCGVAAREKKCVTVQMYVSFGNQFCILPNLC